MTISQIGTAFGKVGSPPVRSSITCAGSSGPPGHRYHADRIADQHRSGLELRHAALTGHINAGAGLPVVVRIASSTSSSNCYFQYVPYCDHTPATWEALNWGGTNSYYQTGTSGSSWTTPDPAFDLVFSMQ